jgi:hypothetical protein
MILRHYSSTDEESKLMLRPLVLGIGILILLYGAFLYWDMDQGYRCPSYSASGTLATCPPQNPSVAIGIYEIMILGLILISLAVLVPIWMNKAGIRVHSIGFLKPSDKLSTEEFESSESYVTTGAFRIIFC